MKIFADMDTEQFWLTLWSLAAVCFFAMLTVIGFSSYHEDEVLRELVLDGHDVMELACLFSGSNAIEVPCVLIAQAKAKVMTDDTE